LECTELAEAGVVDEDVDFEAGGLGCFVNLLRRSGIVEVGCNDPDICTLTRELGGQGIDLCGGR